MRYKLTIEYDGTGLLGWQEQLKKELEPPAAEQAAFASEQVVPPCSIQ